MTNDNLFMKDFLFFSENHMILSIILIKNGYKYSVINSKHKLNTYVDELQLHQTMFVIDIKCSTSKNIFKEVI